MGCFALQWVMLLYNRLVLAETGRLFLYLKVNNQTSDAPLMLLSARHPYSKALKVPTGTRKGVAVSYRNPFSDLEVLKLT